MALWWLLVPLALAGKRPTAAERAAKAAAEAAAREQRAAEAEAAVPDEAALRRELEVARTTWQQQPEDPHALQAAVDVHEVFLAHHGAAADAWAIRCGYGAMLAAVGREVDAWAQLHRGVVAGPTGPDVRPCVEDAIEIGRARLPNVDGDGPIAVPPEPQPMTDDEAAWVAVVEHALRSVPNDATTQPWAWGAARVWLTRGRVADALPLLDRAIRMDPGAELARRAALLYLEPLAQRDDFTALETAALRYALDPGLGDPAFRARLWRIAENAGWRRVERDHPDGSDLLAAAEAWRAWRERYPEAERAKEALERAAAAYRAAGKNGKARKMERIIRKRYAPTSG